MSSCHNVTYTFTLKALQSQLFCLLVKVIHTHLLGEVIVHLSGHGDPLVICHYVVLEEAHRLHGAARVGLEGAQNSAVVLPVAGQLLEHQSLLVCFPLQCIYPQCTGEQRGA